MAESKPTYVQGLKYLRTKSYSESSGIMNYRFLTTKTNSKALYIFCCCFTTSSVKLFVVTVQILV